MRIYVGNLPHVMDDQELRSNFEPYGQVLEVVKVKDRETGRSKGIAFVEMPDRARAEAAITGLNGKEFYERIITVNEARPRTGNGLSRSSLVASRKDHRYRDGGSRSTR